MARSMTSNKQEESKRRTWEGTLETRRASAMARSLWWRWWKRLRVPGCKADAASSSSRMLLRLLLHGCRSRARRPRVRRRCFAASRCALIESGASFQYNLLEARGVRQIRFLIRPMIGLQGPRTGSKVKSVGPNGTLREACMERSTIICDGT